MKTPVKTEDVKQAEIKKNQDDATKEHISEMAKLAPPKTEFEAKVESVQKQQKEEDVKEQKKKEVQQVEAIKSVEETIAKKVDVEASENPPNNAAKNSKPLQDGLTTSERWTVNMSHDIAPAFSAAQKQSKSSLMQIKGKQMQ